MKRSALLSAVLTGIVSSVWGQTTWYVRTDGGLYGTDSTHCNGQTDAAFSGSNGPACAVNHPFEVLGIRNGLPRATQISGGDTVIIKNGSYRMGYTAGLYDANTCAAAQAYECYMDEIPSGSDANNKTKIYGEEWNSGCSTKPELWGASRVGRMLNLDGSSNIDVRCLEFTDHDDCGSGSSVPNACDDSSPYTDKVHARVAVFGYNGSNNEFRDIDAHGMAREGFQMGKQTDLTMTDVNIIGNGFAGLDLDTANADDSWAGTNTFTRVNINWSGCAENYPVDGDYNNCVDQNNAGYGDALGSPDGGTGGTWVWTDCQVKFNTSDGLDFLHASAGLLDVTIERCFFEGNVGNDIKVGSGDVVLLNNVVISNCGFFEDWAGTKGSGFSACRAGGNAIVIDLSDNAVLDIVNNTIVGEPDILISVHDCEGGTEVANVKNNILQGGTQFGGADTVSWYFGYNGCDESELIASNNVIYDMKEASPCSDPLAQSDCYETDPNFPTYSVVTDTFDLVIESSSDAIDNGLDSGTSVGNTSVPTDDYRQLDRDANVDIGAYEAGASSPAPQSDISGATLSGVAIQ